MIRLDSRVVIACGTLVFALVAACSSPAPKNDSGDDDQDQDTTTPAKAPKSTSSSSSSSSSSGGASSSGGSTSSSSSGNPTPPGDPKDPQDPNPPAGGMCAAETTADACFNCCAAGKEQALDQAYQVFDTCACQTPGVCKTQCGNNYCAGQQPSQACEQCLDGAQQCATQADQACAANAQCKAALDCMDASQCDAKQ